MSTTRTQAEYTAVHNELQRLRTAYEAQSRELSNVRIQCDELRCLNTELRSQVPAPLAPVQQYVVECNVGSDWGVWVHSCWRKDDTANSSTKSDQWKIYTDRGLAEVDAKKYEQHGSNFYARVIEKPAT